MATQITKWQAEDGTLHDTEQEALDYERRYRAAEALRAALYEDTMLSAMDADDFVNNLSSSRDLRKALRAFLGTFHDDKE
jgi:hypothetical protein